MTGFADAVRGIIAARSGGVCEVCGAAPAVEMHHRRARGIGGSKRPDTSLVSNGLHVCGQDHRLIESRRGLALLLGWLVPSGFDPQTSPCLRRGEWVFLELDGGLRYTDDDFAEASFFPETPKEGLA